jgi:parallel beta-helix repeat protein
MKKITRRKLGTALLLSFCLVWIGSITAEAATYYVATTGSDSNPGTLSQPFSSILKGVSVLRPGDTTFIRAGTYAESIPWSFNFPSGTSWSSAVTLAAYPGEIVTMRPNGGSSVIDFGGDPDQYIIIDGIHFDAINLSETAIAINQGSNHIRFQNCEIKNAYKSGVYILWGNNNGLPSNYNEFINCEIHHNGRMAYNGGPNQPPGYGAGHGLYITTQNNVFRGNQVHHNGNWGFHVYFEKYPTQQTANNLIEGNLVYENGNDVTRYGHPCCGGIILSSGSGNMAYNNVVFNHTVEGIDVGTTGANVKVYNNTFYNNAVDIRAFSGGSGNIQNNIAYPHGVSIASGYVVSNNLTSNPGFSNVAKNDFRLLSTSLSAIDKGVILSEVIQDHGGRSRPQGSTHDIGAYEFGITSAAPAPPRNLNVR